MSHSNSDEQVVRLRSKWRNVNSGREAIVSRVGPSDVHDGALRVWLADEDTGHSWGLDGRPGGFFRCWEPME